MRRSLLYTSIAVGTLLMGGALWWVTPSGDEKIKSHEDRMRRVALCQKAYEIAGSFPSYVSSQTKDPESKRILMASSSILEARSEELANILKGSMRQRAQEIGMDPVVYDARLLDITAAAEREVVFAMQGAEEPLRVLGHFEKDCGDLRQ